jgi:putative intracellular protease/amidase
VAKLLAQLPTVTRRVEVLRNWDFLERKAGDVTLILETAQMIRDVARHADLDRATERLVERVESP